MKNITLIGMSGVGKSTVGKLLAMGTRQFHDTDTMLAKQLGYTHVDQVLEAFGPEWFLEMESYLICNHQWSDHFRFVIATGGSVIYKADAMEVLKRISTVVYLRIPHELLAKRVSFEGRGIVNKDNLTFSELHAERHELYAKWADITVETRYSAPDAAARVIGKLGKGF